MLISGVKSRPTYSGLAPDPNAKFNVVVCDRDGSEAVVEMFRQAAAGFASITKVLLCAEGAETTMITLAATSLKPAAVEIFPTRADTITAFGAVLATAKMSTRAYVAGSEPLIGLVVQEAMAHGMDHKSVRTEHRGSLKRRVQCVHCKGFTENVTTNPVICANCGYALIVRDHYSRRLAAFQGVRVDAEVPGEIPELTEEFL
jgi:predicted RNA-binding Zn-ribbon protein involved in translation (DUF1610 family)